MLQAWLRKTFRVAIRPVSIPLRIKRQCFVQPSDIGVDRAAAGDGDPAVGGEQQLDHARVELARPTDRLLDEAPCLLGRHPLAPAEHGDLAARHRPEPIAGRRPLQRPQQDAHLMPVLDRLCGVRRADPSRRAGRLVRGFGEPSGRLVVMREKPGELVGPVAIERLDRLRHLGMEGASPGPELRRVGDFLGQRMNEGEPATARARLLVEQPGVAQHAERGLDVADRRPGNLLKHRQREFLADDGADLEQRLVRLAQPVDARAEHRLDGRGKDLLAVPGARHVGALLAGNDLLLRERADQLLGEERISGTPPRHAATDIAQPGVPADQLVQDRIGLRRADDQEAAVPRNADAASTRRSSPADSSPPASSSCRRWHRPAS